MLFICVTAHSPPFPAPIDDGNYVADPPFLSYFDGSYVAPNLLHINKLAESKHHVVVALDKTCCCCCLQQLMLYLTVLLSTITLCVGRLCFGN